MPNEMTSTNNSNILRELKLHSPVGFEPAVFTWPSIERQATKKDAVFIGGDEIVKTIRLVFEDYPELYQQNLGLATCDIHSYSHMKELCDKFNKIIDTHIKLNRGTEAFSARLQQRATAKLFRHVLAQVYSRAVTDPEKLRDYEPFSPSVYGETSPDLIDSILKSIHLNEEQMFIDLGSGVGNVVLHVSALANCKFVYGIEHEETPATYARAMSDEFRFWMRWYGKRYSDFLLEQGDFLDHPKIDERIREADVIFANNYVFGSTVNHELKVKFMNMKDGAKIVSSREFCPETFRLNDRTKNDLGAVMHVSKPDDFSGKVSWSDKSVQYYLHVVDHSKLAHYYEKLHQSHGKGLKAPHLKSNDDEHSLSPSSSNGKAPRLSKGTESETSKRKRPINSTAVSGRGRKIQRKIPEDKADSMDENVSDFDSDLSNEDSNAVKRASHSTKAYHATLEELHQAAGRYPQANDNQRFNNRSMTKLTDENLHLQHFRDCLGEQEDRQFFNSINTYLDQFRQRLFAYFNYMKSSTYREHIKQQLDNEMELNKTLKAKVHCLENNIKTLLEDAIDLLKLRTNELGVEELERPAQLITYANDISNKHKELRSKVASLEKEIAEYDQENDKLSFILTNIQTNGHRSTSSSSSPPLPSSSGLHSSNDNVYSTLLASMSRQTQQQEKHHPIVTPSYDVMKAEEKSDFVIQKRTKKSSEMPNDGHTLVSPIKIIKVNNKRPSLPNPAGSPSSSATTGPTGINNLLSTKQLEPLQVHSVISSVGQQSKQSKTPTVVQSINVKTLLNTSPPTSQTKTSSSSKIDEISQEMIMQSPRKKRDFYGKSAGPPTASSPSSHRSHRHLTTGHGSSSGNNRPSSTPACTSTAPGPPLPDRPVSIPPLKTSS